MYALSILGTRLWYYCQASHKAYVLISEISLLEFHCMQKWVHCILIPLGVPISVCWNREGYIGRPYFGVLVTLNIDVLHYREAPCILTTKAYSFIERFVKRENVMLYV